MPKTEKRERLVRTHMDMLVPDSCTVVLGGVGHENPIDANLLASAFNLINDNLPHTVTPHNSYT